ncbi:MAG TPA: hypothetical protein VHR97_06925 [Candidatus Baltobacteraceae bacterium]|jgi:hypothetical protein|nr:hypothetical protein [Candidatus Baltobacteraceae bacterium]
MKRLVPLALSLALAAFGTARADKAATFHGPADASENAFVGAIAKDLASRYPTAADAQKAGYVRYTIEDESGAISYANMQWQSTDIRHPSQLWYDKNGQLLGADYSILVSRSPSRPQLWGVNPGRWVEFDGHMHWVTKDPATGALTYDQWAWDKAFVAAGGNPEHPSAATLVAMKKVDETGNVVTVFHFPAVWDLIVWVKANPNGAFADKNPLVQP